MQGTEMTAPDTITKVEETRGGGVFCGDEWRWRTEYYRRASKGEK